MVQLTQSNRYPGNISIVDIPQPFKQTNDSKMPIFYNITEWLWIIQRLKLSKLIERIKYVKIPKWVILPNSFRISTIFNIVELLTKYYSITKKYNLTLSIGIELTKIIMEQNYLII
jgi:hypothetical protein